MRTILLSLALLAAPIAASAQTVLHSPPLWCEVGGQAVATQGLHSTNKVQRSFPSCTVTVYNAGTTSVATIFSDATPTAKANPFTALTNGKIDFYAASACYDIVTSGGTGTDTFPSPITYFGVCLGGAGGGGGGGGGGGSGTVTSVGLGVPAGFSVTGSPVTGVGTLALSMPAGWTNQDLLVGNGVNSVARLPRGADQTCLTLVAGVITWGVAPCVGIPAGTTNQIPKYANGPGSTLGNSSLFDDGSNPVQAPNGLSVMSQGLPRVILNANPATTVLNQLVERNASGLAINATTSSLRALGVAGQNAGVNSAPLQVTSVGYGDCIFDGTTVINDYAVPSSTTAGLCHDAGSTRPLNAEILGTVTTVNTGAGTVAKVDFFTGDTSQTTPSAVMPCGSSPGPMAYYTAASTIGCDVLMLTDGAGNGTMASLTLGGASAGFLFFTASSQPSFPVANSAYLFAPTSIPSTYALKLPSAIGTANQVLTITGVAGNVATLGFTTTSATCPEGTCLINAPTGDQTVAGAHGLILSDPGSNVQTLGFVAGGTPYASFTGTFLAGAAFDPSLGGIGVSGQQQSTGGFGIQGIAQGQGSTGVYGVAQASTNAQDISGGFFTAELVTTSNVLIFPLGTLGNAYTSPAVATSNGGAVGVQGFAENEGAGTATSLQGFNAQANLNTGGGVVATSYGYFSEAQAVGTTSAAFAAADQGSNASRYGILLAGVTHNDLGSGKTVLGSLSTSTNCAGVGTAANPSVATCAAASSGAFSCATAASTGTCQVNTTAVTANSEIIVTQVSDEGARLSVTCNTGSVLPAGPLVTAKSAGASFTITLGTVAVNPGCFDYFIVN